MVIIFCGDLTPQFTPTLRFRMQFHGADTSVGELCRHLSASGLSSHEQAIAGIFNTLRELMNPPQVRAIGFTADYANLEK
jgi:hypothetical protein